MLMNNNDESIVKQDIITAARKVFGKFGYKKASMNDIAAAAGKAKSSLYHYFESKEAIFIAIVKEELDNLVSKSLLEASRYRDPVERLHAYIFAGRGSVGKISKEFGNIIIT